MSDQKTPAGSAPESTAPDGTTVPEMTREEKRHDQLTSAPDATEADAAPRIEVTEHDGVKRIDIAPDAAVRPGPGPGAPGADGSDGDAA